MGVLTVPQDFKLPPRVKTAPKGEGKKKEIYRVFDAGGSPCPPAPVCGIKISAVATSGCRDARPDHPSPPSAVPFTPSQGVRTPSPNNMATLRWRVCSPFANSHYNRADSPVSGAHVHLMPPDVVRLSAVRGGASLRTAPASSGSMLRVGRCRARAGALPWLKPMATLLPIT